MRIRPSSVLALLALALPLCAQEKFTLRYTLQPGPAAWYQQDQDNKMAMKMGERTMNGLMATSMWMECKVAAVKDGVATLESKFARVKAKSDGMGGKTDYDSDVEGSRPGSFRGLAELVGQTVKVSFDDTGKQTNVEVDDDVEAGLEKAGMSMKQTFAQAILTWPKDPIALGDTWTNEYGMPMGQMGKGKVVVTNKLVAVKDHVATVEQTSKIEVESKGLPPGMKLEVTKASGSARIDLRVGMPLEMTTDVEMKIGGGGDTGAAMDMTMTMHSSIKQVPAPAPKAAGKPEDAKK
ncbi:MAG: hypothetical protein JNK15_22500 [Planctomycetes bacterium]|nr:hypothetical protein [Planctomycetota bacterium]